MKAFTWVKMLTAGSVLCIGGPALVYYVSPSEEELFKVLYILVMLLIHVMTSGLYLAL